MSPAAAYRGFELRWSIFAVFAYLALVLQSAVPVLLEVRAWDARPEPSVVLVLMVFIAMGAPQTIALWAALILGFLVDMTSPLPIVTTMQEMRDIALPGPFTLGYVTGAYAVIQIRGMAFRDSPFALAIMVFAAGLFVHLVAVSLISFRGLPIHPADAIPNWHAADELVAAFFNLLYSAILAIPIGFLLIKSDPLWGFPSQRSSSGRLRAD